MPIVADVVCFLPPGEGKGGGMKIAVLGLGRMGIRLGTRLLEGGHELVVWNRSGGKAGELVDAGAKEAGRIVDAVSVAEVAVTVLANDEAVRQVALGDEGVVASLAPDAIYVDSSTVSPKLSAELADAAGTERFAAVPILGAPTAVEEGTAVYLAGGHASVLVRLEPMLASLTDTVHRYARPSQATAAKLASNLMLLAGITALAESFAVGRAGGLSDEQLRDLLKESPMVAPGLRNRFEGLLTGEQESWWTTALGAKDAGLAAELARSAGIETPVAEAVHDRLSEAAAAGFGDDDITAVGHLYRPA
jgi:3-hydroxyisobutyrate dehydrogenase-like beta-hydroxyacid dehydrogenase